jgi:uncharacterized protein (TIGR02284 family)
MSNDDVVDTLDKLIDACKDGEYGFKTRAEQAQSDHLRTVFLERADSSRRGAAELQVRVSRLGGGPETDSRATGTLHRGWVSLKGALTEGNDQAILDECEHGEDAALERYRAAIRKPCRATLPRSSCASTRA